MDACHESCDAPETRYAYIRDGGMTALEETINWLLSECEWEVDAVALAGWMQYDEETGWDAEAVATWLHRDDGAGWDAEHVARWMHSNDVGAGAVAD